MSLKIQNNISSIKINGHYIKEAKLNGYIIFGKQDDTPSQMGSEWLDYNNLYFKGDRPYNKLIGWMYNHDLDGRIHGVYLSLNINSASTLYMKNAYVTGKGCPLDYSVFILDSNNYDAIVNRYDYEFEFEVDSDYSYIERELTINLEQGNYKVVIGSDKVFDFETAIVSISLT